MNKPKNENYCATVIEIKKLIPLVGCNNVQAAIIMGQQVVVGKDVKVGDIGLFFPVECALSKEYLTANNLYRVHKNKPNLNSDTTVKGGYFEESGRIRCAKFLGHKSEGLFMPISSLEFISEDSVLKSSISFFISSNFNILNFLLSFLIYNEFRISIHNSFGILDRS